MLNKTPTTSSPDVLLELTNSVSHLLCVCIDGYIDFINSTGLSLLGYNECEKITDCLFTDFVHPDSHVVFNQYCSHVLTTNQSVSHEVRIVTALGGIRNMEMTFTPMIDTGIPTILIEAHTIQKAKYLTNPLHKNYDLLNQHITDRAYELSLESSERKQIEAELRLTAKIIERLKEGVVSLDSDFLVTSVNPAYTKITGYDENELIGHVPPFISTMNKTSDLVKSMCDALEKKDGWDAEFWDETRDGRSYAVSLSISSVSSDDDDCEHVQYAAVLNDITQRKQDEERIRYQANYDDLTGLPNRSLFMDRLEQALSNSARVSRKLGLMFIDLDGFKLVNDTLGHDAGDELLKEAARRLEKCIRSGDTVARLGGDEFTVIMPNLVNEQDIPIIAQRILDAISAPYLIGDQKACISGSIGIAVSPENAKNAKELLKNADSAMYAAKAKGKATFQFYTSDK